MPQPRLLPSIHRSAWKGHSRNHLLTGFSEVRVPSSEGQCPNVSPNRVIYGPPGKKTGRQARYLGSQGFPVAEQTDHRVGPQRRRVPRLGKAARLVEPESQFSALLQNREPKLLPEPAPQPVLLLLGEEYQPLRDVLRVSHGEPGDLHVRLPTLPHPLHALPDRLREHIGRTYAVHRATHYTQRFVTRMVRVGGFMVDVDNGLSFLKE